MKTISIMLIFMAMNLSGSSEKKLHISVIGLKNNRGFVNIALYNSAETFLKHEQIYKGVRVKPTGKKASVSFDKLPYGTYAVAVFHDENENKKLDKNFLGIPKEGYGFSNNASGMFGPPAFKKAAFTYNSKNKKIAIIMKY